jgi:hypothetical protein
MTTKQWYRAHIRWAVMAEGKEGLRGWKESVYLGRRAVEKAGPWKARKTKSRFSSLPTALGNRAQPSAIPTFPTAPTATGISTSLTTNVGGPN